MPFFVLMCQAADYLVAISSGGCSACITILAALSHYNNKLGTSPHASTSTNNCPVTVCETIGIFNTGAASETVLKKACGIKPGRNVIKAFWKEDFKRMHSAAYKVTEKYRQQRQALRAKRKRKADKNSYGSGAFGLNCKPELKKSKRKHPQVMKRPVQTGSQVSVKFVTQELEVLHTGPKKAKKN